WDDIVRTATDSSIPGHFVGSIVYVEQGLFHISTVPQLLVIDGQKRLTPITLLLTALATVSDAVGSGPGWPAAKLRPYYLFTPEEEGDLRYRLLLPQSVFDELWPSGYGHGQNRTELATAGGGAARRATARAGGVPERPGRRGVVPAGTVAA